MNRSSFVAAIQQAVGAFVTLTSQDGNLTVVSGEDGTFSRSILPTDSSPFRFTAPTEALHDVLKGFVGETISLRCEGHKLHLTGSCEATLASFGQHVSWLLVPDDLWLPMPPDFVVALTSAIPGCVVRFNRKYIVTLDEPARLHLYHLDRDWPTPFSLSPKSAKLLLPFLRLKTKSTRKTKGYTSNESVRYMIGTSSIVFEHGNTSLMLTREAESMQDITTLLTTQIGEVVCKSDASLLATALKNIPSADVTLTHGNNHLALEYSTEHEGKRLGKGTIHVPSVCSGQGSVKINVKFLLAAVKCCEGTATLCFGQDTPLRLTCGRFEALLMFTR